MHRFESTQTWALRPRRVRKTTDSVIELQIVPGAGHEAIVVRARHRLSMHADRVRRQRHTAGVQPATSWPMASVARISLPAAPRPTRPPDPDAPRDPAR